MEITMTRRRARDIIAQGAGAQIDDDILQRGMGAEREGADMRERLAGSGAAEAGALGGIAGVGMGAVFGGPVGAAIGGLVGLMSYMSQQREAARAAGWQNTLNEIDERTTRAIDASFDGATTQEERDQAEARNTNWRNTQTLLRQLPPEQGAQVLASLGQSGGLDGGSLELAQAREARQQTLDDQARTAMIGATVDQTRFLRDRAVGLFRDELATRSAFSQFREILGDTDLDINNARTQATLFQLLEQSAATMTRNPGGMHDALAGVGGTGMVGALLAVGQLGLNAVKAEAMSFSREDWAALARAAETAQNEAHAIEREQLYALSAENAEAATRLGLSPDTQIAAMAELYKRTGPSMRGGQNVFDQPMILPRGSNPQGRADRPVNGAEAVGVVRGAINSAGSNIVGGAIDLFGGGLLQRGAGWIGDEVRARAEEMRRRRAGNAD